MKQLFFIPILFAAFLISMAAEAEAQVTVIKQRNGLGILPRNRSTTTIINGGGANAFFVNGHGHRRNQNVVFVNGVPVQAGFHGQQFFFNQGFHQPAAFVQGFGYVPQPQFFPAQPSVFVQQGFPQFRPFSSCFR